MSNLPHQAYHRRAPQRNLHALAWCSAALGGDFIGMATLTDLTRVWQVVVHHDGQGPLRLVGLPLELHPAARVALDALVLDPGWRSAHRRCA